MVEVSPLLSYEGEELAAQHNGKVFDGNSISLEPPASPPKL